MRKGYVYKRVVHLLCNACGAYWVVERYNPGEPFDDMCPECKKEWGDEVGFENAKFRFHQGYKIEYLRSLSKEDFRWLQEIEKM